MGYSITGSNEYGGSVLPVIGAAHNWPDNIEANVCLIVAAPDMLAALEAVRANIEHAASRHGKANPLSRETWNDLLAALAKAKPCGESA